MIKIILILALIIANSFACPPFKIPIPIADVSVEIDAKKTKTSFVITWDFRKNMLLEHDRNNNKKFDKNEQDEIKKEYIEYIKKRNYITEIVYVKKQNRIKKSLINKINLKNNNITFSNMKIKYSYSFDADFIIKKDYRLFIRILDPKQRVYIALKEINIKGYNDIKTIVIQDIRANIYFYKHVKKSKIIK